MRADTAHTERWSTSLTSPPCSERVSASPLPLISVPPLRSLCTRSSCHAIDIENIFLLVVVVVFVVVFCCCRFSHSSFLSALNHPATPYFIAPTMHALSIVPSSFVCRGVRHEWGHVKTCGSCRRHRFVSVRTGLCTIGGSHDGFVDRHRPGVWVILDVERPSSGLAKCPHLGLHVHLPHTRGHTNTSIRLGRMRTAGSHRPAQGAQVGLRPCTARIWLVESYQRAKQKVCG